MFPVTTLTIICFCYDFHNNMFPVTTLKTFTLKSAIICSVCYSNLDIHISDLFRSLNIKIYKLFDMLNGSA